MEGMEGMDGMEGMEGKEGMDGMEGLEGLEGERGGRVERERGESTTPVQNTKEKPGWVNRKKNRRSTSRIRTRN
jgi:hypothetical protein